MTLKTTELAKSFKGRAVVKGVSLSISSGKAVGLLGPNGAGKTTLVRAIAGFLAPASGRIALDTSTRCSGAPDDDGTPERG